MAMLSRLTRRLSGLLGNAGNAAPTPAPPSPRKSADAEAAQTYDAIEGPACPRDVVLALDQCPVCGAAEFTKVCRYNRFVLFDRVPDADVSLYNYSLCHSCGVVFAARRPAGARYAWLLEHFEETIGRVALGQERSGKITISSHDLTDEGKRDLRRMASHGVFVSSHLGLARRDYLPSLMNDRLAASVHAEILGSLLPLKTPRVLEIRSRLGSLSAILARLYDARCHVMTLFQNQQFLVQELYGMPVASHIDFDAFQVPFEGTFDLIVSNHMLTHAVRPREFLAAVRERLAPGGHLYLYGEPVETEFLERGKSMFNTLNAFHLQTFDQASAIRALEANGFRVVFCTVRDDLFMALAQVADPADGEWTAILRVPESLRAPFAHEWDEVARRAVAAGTAVLGKDGRVTVKRVEVSGGG
jgi:SAM-dependent methyltransferase